MHRNILLLALCQALMMSATSLTMSSSALAGLEIAPSAMLATIPLALSYLAVMLSLLPASFLMKRYGRRVGFAVGASVGLVSGLVCGYSIYHSLFIPFCAGSFMLGVAMAFAQFYRFAAAEVASEEYRSRAISWVLAGGLIAAFAGPSIARYTQHVLPGPPFSLSFLSIALICLGILLVQFFLRIPLPSHEERTGATRPLFRIVLQPVFLVAVLCAMIAYGTMNLLMTATPLAMDQRGFQFGQTATVIQWHIVGMFAPSFFCGHLIHRLGVLILIICVFISRYGSSYLHFMRALIFLGLGWNFLYVGGTTLLTESYWPAEKAKAQGFNDLLVFSAVATTAMSSGYLHYVLGWERLNQLVIPVLMFAGITILMLGLWNQRPQLSEARG
jgi:MFS family permease